MATLKKMLVALSAIAMLWALSGCELAQLPQATPTANVEQVASATPTEAPTLTSSVTLTTAPPLVEATATATAGPPTETPTITPTPNPYATYVLQPGDTLLRIIQLPPFYYHSDTVITEILRLNPNIPDMNHLPGPGSSIIIPLPTATTTPQGFDLTSTADPNRPAISLPGNAQIIQVTVEEGQAMVGIAESNSTTLAIIATLNPQLYFIGCDFTNPSGGPDCSVSLRPGEVINVPALTPTPTLSPTFSGSETATLTPTYAAPTPLFPPEDGTVSARTFQLQWLSAGMLRGNEVYLVEIEDETAGTQHVDIANSTSYELPDALVPTDGQTHTIHWRISVAEPNDQGAYRYIGGRGEWRTFHWQSR